MTTIPAPVQKSHQCGWGTIATPPTMKPTMMIETATQEAGRPWCSSCPYDTPGLRVKAVRPGVSRGVRHGPR